MTAQPLPALSLADDLLTDAAQLLVDGCAESDRLSPEAAAVAACSPGDDVAAVTDLIRAQRGLHAP